MKNPRKKSPRRRTAAIVGSTDVVKDVARKIEKPGVRILQVRAIGFKPVRSDKKGTTALQNLESFDRLFFTSRNSVRFFMKEIKRRRIRIPASMKISAVGPETAKAVRAEGLRVSFIPKKTSARDLSVKKDSKALFPKSNLAEKIPGTVPIVVYETVSRPISKKLLRKIEEGKADRLVFTSPSAVASLLKQISDKKMLRKISAIAIGPTTAAALRAAKFKKIGVARSSDANGIASLLRRGA